MTIAVQHQNATTPTAPTLSPALKQHTEVLESLRRQAEAWEAAIFLGERYCKSSFAGPFKGKPEDYAVAILSGASLGIPAEQIGKSIYVVHGTPALYGKTALSIAKNHGYKFERVEYGPKKVRVQATAPDGSTDFAEYTYARAEREGLVKGNRTQYETRPEKMLFWKCIGELADQFFPHLLNGMPIKEDWEQSPTIKVEWVGNGNNPTATNAMDAVTRALGTAQPVDAEVHIPAEQPQREPAAAPRAPEAPATNVSQGVEMDEQGYPILNTGDIDNDLRAMELINTQIKTAPDHNALQAIANEHLHEFSGIHNQAVLHSLDVRDKQVSN